MAGTTGAVILAAGITSDEKRFSPFANLGSISPIERMISTLWQANRNMLIAVVTGEKTNELNYLLSNKGVIFLNSEHYDHSEMLDSVKIGLDFFVHECGHILISPCNVPLYTVSTVLSLMNSAADIALPVYHDKIGHPVMITSDVAKYILSDRNHRSLYEALMNSGFERELVEVDDPAILGELHAECNPDIPGQLEKHNRQMLYPELKLSLCREQPFMNERTWLLLDMIRITGSVLEASKRTQISYRTCWTIIHRIEKQLGVSVVKRNQGGQGTNRSYLTENGTRLLEDYMNLRMRLNECVSVLFREYFRDYLQE